MEVGGFEARRIGAGPDVPRICHGQLPNPAASNTTSVFSPLSASAVFRVFRTWHLGDGPLGPSSKDCKYGLARVGLMRRSVVQSPVGTSTRADSSNQVPEAKGEENSATASLPSLATCDRRLWTSAVPAAAPNICTRQRLSNF